MRRGKDEDDEVEQLLQAAQDEMILKLSVDSHASRSKPDYLDPDLHSRFLALRSKPSQQQKTKTKKDQKRRSIAPTKSKDVEETPDDLMLRFAALKSTLPSSSVPPSVLRPGEMGDDADELGEDDEVEKLIQWAIDAARLDPSPPSDDDDDDENRSSDNDDENGSKRHVKP
ncbi:unnamed protein product [Brassica rapa]|uniref:Uncharacterized protein n=1 Tax=Brassica campestris TaxID=3711 RepID=A0A3P5Z884_BRACM|nr:unnamed protein product [Brassica rapa]VDC75009.1 unnamed protein product [Brassica rapa]